MTSNPLFSRLAAQIRASLVPAELKNKLLLIFYRMSPEEQTRILTCLESNKEALPIFAEFVTELEQGNVNLTDAKAIENLLEKYLVDLKK